MAKPGFEPGLSISKYNVLNILLLKQVENHIRIIGNKLLSQMKNGNIKSLVRYNEELSHWSDSPSL